MAFQDLFRSNWKHSKGATRVAAVKKLTDQRVLAKLVKTDVDWTVRRAAVRKLTDQALLAEIATTNEDPYVRWTAEHALTDRTLLTERAATDETSDAVREHRKDHAASDPAGTEEGARTAAASGRDAPEAPEEAPARTEVDQARAADPSKAPGEAAQQRTNGHARLVAETEDRPATAVREARAATAANAAEARNAQSSRPRTEGEQRLATKLARARAEIDRQRIAEVAGPETGAKSKRDDTTRVARECVEAEAAEAQSVQVARVHTAGEERLATEARAEIERQQIAEARAEIERQRVAEAGRLETEAASKRDTATRDAREDAEAEAATVLTGALADARAEADRALATALAEEQAEVERERVAAHVQWEAETKAQCDRAGRDARAGRRGRGRPSPERAGGARAHCGRGAAGHQARRPTVPASSVVSGSGRPPVSGMR